MCLCQKRNGQATKLTWLLGSRHCRAIAQVDFGKPDYLVNSSGDATFELWFRPKLNGKDLSIPQVLFETGGLVNGLCLLFKKKRNTCYAELRAKHSISDKPEVSQLEQTVLKRSYEQFAHVVAVCSSTAGTIQLYVDGEGSEPKDFREWQRGPDPAGLGCVHGHVGGGDKGEEFSSFFGEIAIFRIYSKALSAEDVKSLYDEVVNG